MNGLVDRALGRADEPEDVGLLSRALAPVDFDPMDPNTWFSPEMIAVNLPGPMPFDITELPGAGYQYVTPMEAFRFVLGTWASPAVWGTQLSAAVERNLQGLRGDRPRQLYLPEFSTLEEARNLIYPNEEDPGLALSNLGSLGGMNPTWILERMVRGGPETEEMQYLTTQRALIPDTPEESAAILRNVALGVQAAGITTAMPGGEAMAAVSPLIVPVGSALWNEQIAAEMTHDPLLVVDFWGGMAAINGLKAANRTLRGTSLVYDEIVRSLDSALISPISNSAAQLAGQAHRNVYRFARPFLGQTEYGISQVAEEATLLQKAIRESVGDPWTAGAFYREEIAPRITHLAEQAPEWLRQDIGITAGILGPEDAFDDIVEYVSRAFPDVPRETQRLIAAQVNEQWMLGKRLPEVDALYGLPSTPLLSDDAHIIHVLTGEAKRAQRSSILDWRARLFRGRDNIIGDTLIEPQRRRTWRQSLEQINEFSMDGRVGFVDGQARMIERGAITPEGWVGVSKLFVEDPRILSIATYSRHARAWGAADFLRAAARNAAFISDDITAPTLAKLVGGAESREFQRTFGRLGDEFINIAKQTAWRDLPTAQAVLQYSRQMMDLSVRPAPILRVYDRALAVLKGLTLTPFMPYHIRNHIGGLNNHFLAGGDMLDWIDAAFATTRSPQYLREFRQVGLHNTGQIRHAWASSLDDVYTRSFERTYIGSQYYRLNPVDRDFIGKTVAEAIENQQRLATFISGRRRGLDVEAAARLAYKYHFDYADLPPWMQLGQVGAAGIFRRVTYFPIWTLKNIPIQLEHLFTRPAQFGFKGRYMAHSERAAMGDWRDMPEFVREGAGFAMPSMDPDKPLFFRPENFDPAATLSEISDPARFVWELLNPFVTEPIEQLAYTVPAGGFGGPRRAAPTLPVSPLAEPTGYDVFFERAVYRPWVEWNPALTRGEDIRMPEWAQRADHAMRSFFRFYGESATAIREAQRIVARESAYDPAEIGARKFFGIPLFASVRDQTLYYALKDNDENLSALWRDARRQDDAGEETSPETLEQLKTYYLQRIAQLSHGTFMEVNPWDGTPRPWFDIAQDGDFTIQGRRDHWRDLLQTFYLLFYGRRSHDPAAVYRHDPIPLDDSEMAFLTELMAGNIDAYIHVVEAMSRAQLGIDVGRETEYALGFEFPPLPEPVEAP